MEQVRDESGVHSVEKEVRETTDSKFPNPDSAVDASVKSYEEMNFFKKVEHAIRHSPQKNS